MYIETNWVSLFYPYYLEHKQDLILMDIFTLETFMIL